MLRGFKNFLMRGDVVVVAIGLIVALAFSTLIKAFTDFNQKTFLDFGSLFPQLSTSSCSCWWCTS
jgi:large-conductance mechanosensitive channel